ncbi:hypothetical protein [Pontivivens insulae]|uniref:Uncharacterized protein n=1 Tax=Pontivivens insulae TaxID=1639689 RepID=A0A2R8A9G4_9RHOB|nr:hypothetical protein [Pontivivens insulae]RED18865.1 hypothetical protein DFR53_1067 [Pontivivens insulae]SPF28765.1 hypothetical protein POI8812_01068 [Pontivivens insulae]
MRDLLITWAAAWPTITVLLLLMDGAIGQLPLAVRTLVLTALMVPLMTMLVVPALNRFVGHLESKHLRSGL